MYSFSGLSLSEGSKIRMLAQAWFRYGLDLRGLRLPSGIR